MKFKQHLKDLDQKFKKKNRITAFDNIEVFDQGYSYTCVANAISSALQVFLRNKHNYDVPSRTFIYSICKYNNYSRWDCNYDTVYTPGLEDSNALQTCNKYVIPNEKTLPFPPLSLLNSGDGGALCSAIPDNLIIKPSNRTIKFREIPRGTNQIRQAIDAGHPVIIDILLYSSSLKADTDKNHLGFIPLPDFKKDQYWGGHALVIIGYDDKTQLLKLRNSWGKNYGNHTGDYTISYHYIWSNTLDNSGYTATTGLWEIIDYS